MNKYTTNLPSHSLKYYPDQFLHETSNNTYSHDSYSSTMLPTNLRYCEYCGQVAEKDARFCAMCGMELRDLDD